MQLLENMRPRSKIEIMRLVRREHKRSYKWRRGERKKAAEQQSTSTGVRRSSSICENEIGASSKRTSTSLPKAEVYRIPCEIGKNQAYRNDYSISSTKWDIRILLPSRERQSLLHCKTEI